MRRPLLRFLLGLWVVGVVALYIPFSLVSLNSTAPSLPETTQFTLLSEVGAPPHNATCNDDLSQVNASDLCRCSRLTKSDDSLINYAAFHFCDMKSAPGISVVILIFVLLFLFYMLAATADDYLVPTLEKYSNFLGLSPNVAGVTFLAFGNGAPDVFTSFASFEANGSIGMGSILGAGVFVTTTVLGTVILVAGADGFSTARRPFIRDVLFYLSTCFVLVRAFWDQQVTLIESCTFMGLYLAYVSIVIIGRKVYQAHKKKMREAAAQAAVGVEGEVTDELKSPLLLGPQGDKRVERAGSEEGLAPGPDIVSSYHDARFTMMMHRRGSLEENLLKEAEWREAMGNNATDNSLPMGKRVRACFSLFLDTAITTVTSPVKLAQALTVPHLGQVKTNGQAGYEHSVSVGTIMISDDPDPSSATRLPQPPKGSDSQTEPGEQVTAMGEVDGEEGSPSPPKRASRPTSVESVTSTGSLNNPGGEDLRSRFVSQPSFFRILNKDAGSDDDDDNSVEFRLPNDHDVTVDPDKDDLLNPALLWLNVVFAPILIVFISGFGSAKVYTIVGSTCSVAGDYFRRRTYEFPILARSSKGGAITIRLPRWIRGVFLQVGFIMSIVWVYILARELVALLGVFGGIAGIRASTLGLTVLAWGNSIGDTMANVVLSKSGNPQMAAAGCIGSPLFNALMGFGLGLTVFNARHFPESFTFERSETLPLILLFLMTILTTILLVVPLSGWRFSRKLAFVLLPVYVLFMVLAVMTEAGVVPALPYL